MKIALPFALLLLSACTPALAAGEEPASRDVLATAFDFPLLTDAEVEAHRSDARARVNGPGGPVLLRYPGAVAATVDGQPADASRAGPDVLRIVLPPGRHEVEVHRTGEAAPRAALAVNPRAVTTAAEFRSRAAKLQPGDELVVRDGVYAGWNLECTAAGTAERPVVIRPETPGGVVFRRQARVTLRGSCGVFRGFRFEQCGAGNVLSITGSDWRVTQCHFAHCGTPLSTFAHIVEVGMGGDRNRVDHCYFTGSKSMSLAQAIKAVDGVGRDNRFDHNLFRDIYRHWINGQENIQIGQNQRDPTGGARPRCVVESNLFDHAWGDGEIISNKSTGNVIRHNLAAHCRRSAFTLRGGDEVTFEGNVMVNNGDGLRVMGRRHAIRNNLILDQPGWGIHLETGSQEGTDFTASEDSVLTRNTLARCSFGAIGAMPPTASRPHPPRRNAFRENLFAGAAGMLGDSRRLPDSTIRRNLFWPAPEVPAGEDPVVADPRLQGEGVALHPAPDGRGRGLGASLSTADLPPLPRRPVLEPDLFKGRQLFAQDRKNPRAGWQGAGSQAGDAILLENAVATLQQALPDCCVFEWEYQSATFEAAATLSLSGYAISWGGVGADGKPSGLVELRKDGEIVADGADVLLPSQQFRYKGGGMNFKPDTRTAPDPEMAYRFTLLKQGRRLILLLADSRRAEEPVPVIVFEDRGEYPGGGELRIEQRGAGRWRGIAAHAWEYAGNLPPPAPERLTATPVGGGRIALRWENPRPGLIFEVYRGRAAGFALAESARLGVVGRPAFNDFDVAAGSRFFYQVRALNPLGRASATSAVDAAPGSGGPHHRLVPVTQARVSHPFLLEQHPGAPACAWASLSGTEESETGNGVEFRFRVEAAGDYAVWGLVRSPDGTRDSFLASLGDAPFAPWYTGIHRWFEWSRVTRRVKLAAGEHRLRIRSREPGTALAAILVTGDLNMEP